jgi:hypothetical protein
MKIKILTFLFLLPVLMYFATSCKQKSIKNLDHFYTDKGDWDAGRIPFIKPYEAINATKKFGWSINLKGEDFDTGFPNIKRANVIDSMILIYSTNTILHGIDVKQSWHIIIPKQSIEKGFASHQEYLHYLDSIGTRDEPQLHDIDSIADYFETHDTIDWKAIN